MTRHQKTFWRAATAVILAAGLSVLPGCAPQGAKVEFGIGTTVLAGRVKGLGADIRQADPLIVAYKEHYTFIETANGQVLSRPSAHVVTIATDGAYSLSLPADVVGITVFFMAPGKLTETFSFKRRFGMGKVLYDPELKAMPDWRGHFFTYLDPLMQELITDARYRLEPGGQKLLSEWLLRQRDKLIDGMSNKQKD